MKSFTLDGRSHKLHPQVPATQIRWLVGQQHVGAPDDEITKLINERTISWPEGVRASARKYALHCHRNNQQLVKEFRL